MGLIAVEINDAGVRAARAGADGLLVVDGPNTESPGFAHVQDGAIVTGAAAHARCCLHPLAVHSRYWDQLDTEPIDARNARSPNRAEVACAHLQQILGAIRGPDDDVVLAVSPALEREQLGVLVAIARELGVPLCGLVASPVALDAVSRGGSALVVDLGLHRGVLSIVESGERVTLGRTQLCPEVGLEAFRRQWIRAIGSEFVRTTRFDPMHDAATEQHLHDRLPELLDAIAREGSATLPIEAGPLVHRVTITDQLVAQAGHGLAFTLAGSILTLLAANPVEQILLAHDAARTPGLESLLRQQSAVPVRSLPAGAAALGLTRHWPDRFPTPDAAGVAYHTWRHGAPVPAPTPGEPAS